MKYIVLAFCLWMPFILLGKSIKINQRTACVTMQIKLDKFEEQKDGTITLKGEIRQKRNFCYSVLFEGCNIVLCDGEKISGTLTHWDGYPAGSRFERTVSDEENEKFIITFPNFYINKCDKVTLDLGKILNREKSPIIIQVEIPNK